MDAKKYLNAVLCNGVPFDLKTCQDSRKSDIQWTRDQENIVNVSLIPSRCSSRCHPDNISTSLVMKQNWISLINQCRSHIA